MATATQQSFLASANNASDETDIIILHNELSSLVRRIPKHNVLTIGGDRNAQ